MPLNVNEETIKILAKRQRKQLALLIPADQVPTLSALQNTLAQAAGHKDWHAAQAWWAASPNSTPQVDPFHADRDALEDMSVEEWYSSPHMVNDAEGRVFLLALKTMRDWREGVWYDEDDENVFRDEHPVASCVAMEDLEAAACYKKDADGRIVELVFRDEHPVAPCVAMEDPEAAAFYEEELVLAYQRLNPTPPEGPSEPPVRRRPRMR